MAQKLRALLLNAQTLLPSSFFSILGEYEKRFNVDLRGTFLQDRQSAAEYFTVAVPWSIEKAAHPSSGILPFLREWLKSGVTGKTIRQNKIQRFGQAFQPARRSLGNSQIVFARREGINTMSCAGRIREIVTYGYPNSNEPRILLLVDEFLPLTPGEEIHDPARLFPDFGAKLYHTVTNTTLVPAEHIVCHFASIVRKVQGIDGDCIFVLPLRRR